MPDTPTPGQVNYEAWARAAMLVHPVGWSTLTVRDRQCWEAAAQAVLDAARATPAGEDAPHA